MPQSRCQICNAQSAKYACPACLVPYCSVPCYKAHRSATSCARAAPGPETSVPPARQSEEDAAAVADAAPLRALTSLKWPYIPEEGSSVADPLTRDDPKRLQLHHYEAIATSAGVRAVLAAHPGLKAALRRVDVLRGAEREEALEALLGVHGDVGSGPQRRRAAVRESEEDQRALKELAEAVEKAVRGEKRDALGLDWAEDGRGG